MNYHNSAFPRKIGEQAPGLTKREIYAAMALQALLSNPYNQVIGKTIAQDAVKMADLLIQSLNED